MRPGWLADCLPWQKLCHDRFDIKHGCSVDGVEFGNEEPCTFHADHPADGAPDAIRPILCSVRKNA